MNRKIRENSVFRMLTEGYNRLLMEDNENAKENAYKPLDVAPGISGGNSYIYINFADINWRKPKEEGGKDMDTVGEQMVAKFNEISLKKQGKPLSAAAENNILDHFKSEINYRNNPPTFYIKLKIDKPETVLREEEKDGKVVLVPNRSSSDYARAYKLMGWIAARTGISRDYIEPELDNALRRIYHYSSETYNKKVSPGELKKDFRRMFFNLCEKFGTPEVLQKLKTLKIDFDDAILDIGYEEGNKLRVMEQAEAYGPDVFDNIKYLATDKRWEEYGRRVVDRSQPFYMVTYNSNRHGQKSRDVANDFGKMVGNTGRAQRGADQFAGRYIDPNAHFSVNAPYFDISATVLIKGAYDTYNNDPGYEDNIRRILNQKGQEEKERLLQSQSTDGETVKDVLGNSESYDNVSTKYHATCEVAKKYGVNTPQLEPNASPEEYSSACATIISEIMGASLHKQIIKYDNYKALVPIGTVFVMSMLGIPLDGAPIKKPQFTKDMTDELSSHVNDIAYEIRDKVMEIVKNAKNQNVSKNDALNEMLSAYIPDVVLVERYNNVKKLLF